MIRRLHITLALWLVACGSDGPNFGPETAPTPAQSTAINTMQSSLTTFAKADLTGQQSEAAAFYFAFAGQSLLAGAAAGAGVAPPGLALADCGVVTDHSITWNHCTDQTGYTIDGMISWSPGHVDVDVDWTGTSSGYTFHWSLNGSMSVSSSAIQGDMAFAFSYNYGGGNASVTVRSQIDVGVANGCITNGTLTVTESGSGPGVQSRAVQVVWSGCNMFRVRNG